MSSCCPFILEVLHYGMHHIQGGRRDANPVCHGARRRGPLEVIHVRRGKYLDTEVVSHCEEAGKGA